MVETVAFHRFAPPFRPSLPLRATALDFVPAPPESLGSAPACPLRASAHVSPTRLFHSTFISLFRHA